LVAFRRFWQGEEQIEALGEMADGFYQGRTRDCPLAGALPVGQGL
jgi:hypothetical protein